MKGLGYRTGYLGDATTVEEPYSNVVGCPLCGVDSAADVIEAIAVVLVV